MRSLYLALLFVVAVINASAQSDSTSLNKPATRVYSHYDSVSMAKLNSNANLMIAGGVGLCGASGYLFYQGWKVYHTAPEKNTINREADLARNHKQGTIYLAASGAALVAGAVLIGLGARNKVDFKARKKMMSVQSGLLNDGTLGISLNF